MIVTHTPGTSRCIIEAGGFSMVILERVVEGKKTVELRVDDKLIVEPRSTNCAVIREARLKEGG